MSGADIDVAIFGGGIAGLWLLARLRRRGYNAWLLESDALGGVQSIASQGIIHGGTKYALSGRLAAASRAIADMPGRWRRCLTGDGELDLRGVRLLSRHQYLFASGSSASGLAGFLASKLMRSRVDVLAAGEYPPPFDDPGFRGRLYRLQEPVLDVPALIRVLVEQIGAYCVRIDPRQLQFHGDSFVPASGAARIRPGCTVLAAGAGNAGLLSAMGRSVPAQQLRPLHMLMLRGRLPPLYAHGLGTGGLPRLTITSYPLSDGRQLWYLGGRLAEQGVERDAGAQILAGRRELAELLPWLPQGSLQWSSLRIDRAEPRTTNGSRPDDCFVWQQQRLLTAWPTKLALAPRLADRLFTRIEALGLVPGAASGRISGLPRPAIALPPWEQVTSWS